MNESPEQRQARWEDLKALQEHYRDFRDFYWDCSKDLLGFEPTDMQLDIANYTALGPLYAMVQAQRGEAKTTITGCYVIWSIIHDPTTRALIVSAGSNMAKEVAVWCIQILNGMEVLACLRCDKSHPGARASVEAYDVHHVLKGANKSPSIACVGITANLQGKRADILVPDDIESAKNSATQLMREQLTNLTRDFVSINQHGRIIYLGTPQSTESVYNALPARGFDVRIWPGRYPTKEEELNYGGRLAPLITKAMTADPSLRTGGGPMGDRGQPTDPGMMSEEQLTRKELDQGKSYFNLQYMLDTALSDSDRFPLKLHDLMFYSFDQEDCPSKFIWTNDKAYTASCAVGTDLQTPIFRPAKTSDDYSPYSYKLISVDPAGGGQNGDETGVAVLYACNGYIIVMHVTGIPGGTEPRKLNMIVQLARKFGVTDVLVEQNFGHGAYAQALKAAFLAEEYRVGIEEVFSTGQKELRIIDALEPTIGAHKLLINDTVPAHDVTSTEKYAAEKRNTYRFLHQLKFITRDRGSLVHEDRLEAVSQGVTYLLKVITQHKATQPASPVDKFKDFRKTPGGVWKFKHRVPQGQNVLTSNVMDRFRK